MASGRVRRRSSVASTDGEVLVCTKRKRTSQRSPRNNKYATGGGESLQSSGEGGRQKCCKVGRSEIAPENEENNNSNQWEIDSATNSCENETTMATREESNASNGIKVKEEGPCMTSLPFDLFELVANSLNARELCTLECTSKAVREMATAADDKWQALLATRWGRDRRATFARAAALCGGWKQLYAAKVGAESASYPWKTLAAEEVTALVEGIAASSANAECCERRLSVVFLVDGSGSVTDDDFETMMKFVQDCGRQVTPSRPHAKFCLIQFTNEIRVEIPLKKRAVDDFCTKLSKIDRMNGGTNIADALRKAKEVLAAERRESKCVSGDCAVILLTDGRVDTFQGEEAADCAADMVEELSSVDIYALGVGRGVDKAELTRIISCGERGHVVGDRYFPLRTLDLR